uniref:AlNc14C45G3680 protein n=1 Tax=Albugo laibachii Nc14 TaxID=890382 RepID=F0WAF3_9STRA|nr:AlNc14C45G3680 [Albugo laibachii Nc14]|eukprot:CCA18124.1 AlNc14C45G3680 [Albugo laibachii Nc14]
MDESQVQALNRHVQDDAFPRAEQSCQRFRFEFRTQGNHRVTSPELEERLLLCIRQCEQNKLPIVTGATNRAKVDTICRELVISTSDESAKLNALVFSPGWLIKFQSHHRLTLKRVHGEAAL